MAHRNSPRTLVAVAALAGIAALAQPAGAASRPAYAIAGETIRGTVSSVNGRQIFLQDERGYVDRIALHDGTIVNPTGAEVAPGRTVSIIGHADGSVFRADEIDVTDAGAGYDPGGGYDSGYVDESSSSDAYAPAPYYYPAYPYYPYYGSYPYYYGPSFSLYFGFHGGYRGGYFSHGGYSHGGYSHGGYFPHGGYSHGGYFPHAGVGSVSGSSRGGFSRGGSSARGGRR